MIVLPYGDKNWRYVKPFSSNTGTLWTDGRMDGLTDLLYQYRASVRWHAIKSMKQTTFWRCFLAEDRVLTENVLVFNGESDSTIPTPLQRSTELEIPHWYFDQCLYPHHLLSKSSWASVFPTYFFHSHPFNEMFIVNGKSYCCNDTFTDVRFTSLLAKNI